MTFGETIQAAREKQGLSQKAASDLLHISQSTLSRLENNKQLPDESIIKACVELYNISPEELRNSLNDQMDEHDKLLLLRDARYHDLIAKMIYVLIIGLAIYAREVGVLLLGYAIYYAYKLKYHYIVIAINVILLGLYIYYYGSIFLYILNI